jgi:hypothetical protein
MIVVNTYQNTRCHNSQDHIINQDYSLLRSRTMQFGRYLINHSYAEKNCKDVGKGWLGWGDVIFHSQHDSASEVLVPFYWTTQHQTPADHNLDTHQHDSFKFYTTWLLIKYHIVKLSSKNSKENHWIEYNWCPNSTYKIIYCFKNINLQNNIKMTYPVDIFITFVEYVSLDPHHIHSLWNKHSS